MQKYFSNTQMQLKAAKKSGQAKNVFLSNLLNQSQKKVVSNRYE